MKKRVHGLRDNRDYVPGHGDERFDVTHYDISVGYAPASNRLDGKVTVTLVLQQSTNQIEFDLYRLRVSKVTATAGGRVKFSHRRSRLVLTFASELNQGSELSVTIAYNGSPRPMPGLDGDAGWEELADGMIVASQPHGAPSWFPCNDRPDNKASYSFAISAPKGYTVLANGGGGVVRTNAGSATWNFFQDEPMATYLASLHIGKFDISDQVLDDTQPGTTVTRVAAPAGELARCKHALRGQPDMMKFFTEVYGPYPFEAYTAVVTPDALEIPLEAQSLSIFGMNHMTDRWNDQRLIAHELSHQWFGNSLTLEQWRDIWLHEGFACYSEWLWSEHAGHGATQSHADRYWQKVRDSDLDLVLADPGPDLMFDDRVYKRGALTLHAIRAELGDESFFALLRDWVAENRYGAVTTEQFIEFAANRGVPQQLLQDWLWETEVPARPVVN